jgi:hypothetical protein
MSIEKRPLLFLILLLMGLAVLSGQSHSDGDCLECHGKAEISQITPDGKTRSLFVDETLWKRDVHKKKGMSCTDCHVYASPFIHFREGQIDVNCSRCHPEEEEEYLKNIHFRFNPDAVTPGKELPLCYHCHTRHHVLRHDDPDSSVHEDRIGDTCGSCHAEVMVSGLLEGLSPGKISGHRKGDLGEKFDMKVCISCHYEDSAHGAKRVYKVFCVRCHDPSSKGNVLMGGTHINSRRWSGLNVLALVLLFLVLFGLFLFQGYRSSGKIIAGIKNILASLKKQESAGGNEKADKEETVAPADSEPGEQSQE